MKVKDVSGVGLAAGGPLEDKGDLPVGDGVLGKIVVDDEGVLAVFHEPFPDGATRVGGEILVGRVVRGGGGHDGNIVDGARFLEYLDGAGDVRVLLPYGDVNAIDGTKVGVARFFALLVER